MRVDLNYARRFRCNTNKAILETRKYGNKLPLRNSRLRQRCARSFCFVMLHISSGMVYWYIYFSNGTWKLTLYDYLFIYLKILKKSEKKMSN